MNIKNLLSLFNLRDIEVVVFEKLFYSGETSATELARQVNVSRTSIYDILTSLIEKGLVYESIRGTVKVFAIQSLDKLKLLITEKEKAVSEAKNTLALLKETEKKKKPSGAPNLQVFQGRPALQQMMKDMLIHNNSHVLSYWPIKHVAELLTAKFFEDFHKERIHSNITVDMILPHDESLIKSMHMHLKKEYFEGINVRVVPKGVDFSLGYTIYGENTVRFISSDKESYGFLIKSTELKEMMEGQFKVMWDLSRPVK